MSEKSIQTNIMLAASNDASRLWRNVVGVFELKDGRWLKTGLAVGSSDLIGLTAVTVTPAMVGDRVAIFTAIEVKDQARTTDEQATFIRLIRSLGGIAGIARSPEQYQQHIQQFTRK